MSPDAAADILASLEPETKNELLEEMENHEAAEVELLTFEPYTAGGMMNTEIVVVGEEATRGEVVDCIRFHELYPDQLDNIILINKEATLAGTVPIARLLLSDSDQRMSELAFEPLALRHSRRPRQRCLRAFRQIQSAQPNGSRRHPTSHRQHHSGRRSQPHERKNLAARRCQCLNL